MALTIGASRGKGGPCHYIVFRQASSVAPLWLHLSLRSVLNTICFSAEFVLPDEGKRTVPTETDYLAQEYLHLQKVVEDFDTKVLTVKAWSVTFSAAAIGLSFYEKQRAVLLAAMISAMAFWIMEALIKANQQAYYHRINELEEHFSAERTYKPFQIGRAWSAAFANRRGHWYACRIMCWPHVFMPYLPIVVSAIAFFAGYDAIVRK